MIEPIPPAGARTTEAGPAGTARREAETPPPATGTAPQTAEREQRVVPAGPTFNVQLDGRTMRLYSELRDPETNRVLMRLPAGYNPEAEKPAPPPLSDEA
ncbi:MAG: hypothetical protein DI635_13240 [Pseudoxanthomonas suwonensis]|nr:MAG: hypothetical protein DI635_13240 [Pseudoxanthomonas suwonensis]